MHSQTFKGDSSCSILHRKARRTIRTSPLSGHSLRERVPSQSQVVDAATQAMESSQTHTCLTRYGRASLCALPRLTSGGGGGALTPPPRRGTGTPAGRPAAKRALAWEGEWGDREESLGVSSDGSFGFRGGSPEGLEGGSEGFGKTHRELRPQPASSHHLP